MSKMFGGLMSDKTDKILGLRTLSKAFTTTKLKELEDGHLIVEGPVSMIGVPLENTTIYTLELWEKIIEEYNPMMERRMAYGMLDHPDRDAKDMSTKLDNTYGILLALKISEDKKTVIGTFEIYANDKGTKLQYLLKKGTVGVSIRGTGVKEEDKKNNVIYIRKFNLVGIDFVATPSSVNALFNIQEGVKFGDDSGWTDYEDFQYEFDVSDENSLFLNVEEGIVESVMTSTEDCIFEKTLKQLGIEDYVFPTVLNGLKSKNEKKNKQKKDKQTNIIENVSDLIQPKKEVNLNTKKNELLKMDKEQLAEIILKKEIENLALEYEKKPHGELYRSILLKWVESGLEFGGLNSIVEIITTYLIKIDEANNAQIDLMKQAVAQSKEAYQQNLQNIKNDVEVTKNKMTQDIQQTVAQAKQEVQKVQNLSNLQNQETENIIQEKDKQIADTIGALKELQLGYSDLMESVENMENINNSIMRKVEIIENEKTKISQEREILEREISEKVEFLESNIAKIEKEKEKIKEEKEGVLSEISEKVKELEDNIDLMRKQKRELENEKKEFLTTIENQRNNIDELKENIEKLNTYVEENKSIMESVLKEREAAEKSIDGFSMIAENLSIENNELLQEKKSIIEKIETTGEIIDEMTEKIDFIEKENVVLNMENKKLRETQIEIENKVEEVLSNVEETESIIENINIEKEQIEEERNSYKKQLQSSNRSIDKVNLELSNKNQEIQKLKEEYDKAIKVNKDLSERLEKTMKKVFNATSDKETVKNTRAEKKSVNMDSVMENLSKLSIDNTEIYENIIENIDQEKEKKYKYLDDLIENDDISKKNNKKRKSSDDFKKEMGIY